MNVVSKAPRIKLGISECNASLTIMELRRGKSTHKSVSLGIVRHCAKEGDRFLGEAMVRVGELCNSGAYKH